MGSVLVLAIASFAAMMVIVHVSCEWGRQLTAATKGCCLIYFQHLTSSWGFFFCFRDDGACDGVEVQLFRMMWILITEVRKKDQDLQATYNPDCGGLLRKLNQSLLLQYFISFLSFSWDRDTHTCMHAHKHTHTKHCLPFLSLPVILQTTSIPAAPICMSIFCLDLFSVIPVVCFMLRGVFTWPQRGNGLLFSVRFVS